MHSARLTQIVLGIACLGIILCPKNSAEGIHNCGQGPNIFAWFADCQVAIEKTAARHHVSIKGAVSCIFMLDKFGNPLQVRVLKSWHNAMVDKKAVELVEQSGPYPNFRTYYGPLIAEFDKDGKVSVFPPDGNKAIEDASRTEDRRDNIRENLEKATLRD
jgi:hypothetical protein